MARLSGLHLVVTVGDGVDVMTAALRDGGASVVHVPDADGAAAVVRGELAPGDVVLVKGSRVAGLERVAEAIS